MVRATCERKFELEWVVRSPSIISLESKQVVEHTKPLTMIFLEHYVAETYKSESVHAPIFRSTTWKPGIQQGSCRWLLSPLSVWNTPRLWFFLSSRVFLKKMRFLLVRIRAVTIGFCERMAFAWIAETVERIGCRRRQRFRGTLNPDLRRSSWRKLYRSIGGWRSLDRTKQGAVKIVLKWSPLKLDNSGKRQIGKTMVSNSTPHWCRSSGRLDAA